MHFSNFIFILVIFKFSNLKILSLLHSLNGNYSSSYYFPYFPIVKFRQNKSIHGWVGQQLTETVLGYRQPLTTWYPKPFIFKTLFWLSLYNHFLSFFFILFSSWGLHKSDGLLTKRLHILPHPTHLSLLSITFTKLPCPCPNTIQELMICQYRDNYSTAIVSSCSRSFIRLVEWQAALSNLSLCQQVISSVAISLLYLSISKHWHQSQTQSTYSQTNSLTSPNQVKELLNN